MDVELKPGDPNIGLRVAVEARAQAVDDHERQHRRRLLQEHRRRRALHEDRTGLPTGLIGKANIAVTAANPNRVYMLVEAKPGPVCTGRTTRAPRWALMNATAAMIYRPFYYTTLGADPSNADVVYAGAETFYKSTDGGKTMTPFRTPHTDNHDIWINPNDSNTMIQSNDGGANISNDGGRTWSTQNNQLTAEIYAVFTDNAFPYRLYGAQQDANNTIIVPVQRRAARISPAVQGGPGCETGPLLPHPTDPNVVYGSCKGQYEVLDRRTGTTKSYWIGGQSLYGNSGERTDPAVPARLADEHLAVRSERAVLRLAVPPSHARQGRDVGEDLAGPHRVRSALPGRERRTHHARRDRRRVLQHALRDQRVAAGKGVIWTGANDGPFSVTRDDGKTWARVTPKDLATGGRVAWIDPSPHRRGSAYFAVYRYLLGDYAPYIYKTDDYGTTWKKLTDGTNGIPADTPTRVVREDPNREGLLYAGTEFGMYISFDDGGHWQPFFQNMPQVPINDIRVKGTDLLVATQGRGFWVLDNLSVLEQLAPAVTTHGREAVRAAPWVSHARQPGAARPDVRVLPAGRAGRGGDDGCARRRRARSSTPSAATRPSGGGAGGRGGRGGRAGGARGAGRCRGGRGRRRRGQCRCARSGSGGGGGGFGGRGGGAAPTRVTKDAGLNRVTWNLMGKDNVTMPPGKYQVRLTVSGESQTQPFTVLIDPNVAATGVTPADLVEQYQHTSACARCSSRRRRSRHACATRATPPARARPRSWASSKRCSRS